MLICKNLCLVDKFKCHTDKINKGEIRESNSMSRDSAVSLIGKQVLKLQRSRVASPWCALLLTVATCPFISF